MEVEIEKFEVSNSSMADLAQYRLWPFYSSELAKIRT